MKFGTSVFHSYVHQWSCQLRYNPRLNVDWGLSDGEGLERIWSALSSLVGPLRYCTKLHRLVALYLRATHHNEARRFASGLSNFFRFRNTYTVHSKWQEVTFCVVKWLLKRLSTSRQLYSESDQKLNHLKTNPAHSDQYFETQWNRQRESQLQVMVHDDLQSLEEKVNKLTSLEESHNESELSILLIIFHVSKDLW